MVYNSSTADIETNVGFPKVSELSDGFMSIPDVSISDIADQNQIYARQIRTGNTRGSQSVKGTIAVTDNNNVTTVIMGFSPGAF